MTEPPLTHPAPSPPLVGQGRRRLHPLTPLLRGGRLAVLAVAAISWRGYQDLGTRWWLVVVAAIAVAVLIASVISWAVTGYQVVGRELRIDEGLLWRRSRAIPLERLQSVELVRPLLARLTGLAELRLEVVGGARTEAPLQYLPLAEATALRARLGGNILVAGSRSLVHTLHDAGLVDEYRLMIYPTVLGSGKRLFRDGASAAAYEAVEVRPAGAVALMTLRPLAEGGAAAA